MGSILKVQHISKSYDGRSVVRDISFTVSSGEVVGLLGPNGAGKTTCFGIVVGIVTPDFGDVMMDNQDLTNMSIDKRAKMGLGYLPQESSIFRGLSVEDNIMLVLELIYDDPEQREKVLEELLAEFSISHLRYAMATALSGGERRRLEIARTVALNPKFILLDEPLAGVDPIAVHDIKTLIAKLQSRKIGVLITDHNVRETLDIVDRGYIIYDGRVLMEGKPSDIVASSEVKRIYLGDGFSY
ncbi:MAG: export transporter ATP-binding protein [Pseudomonadota bacterium]|jgi:lipopolysaccharide export system ATP-binding protein